MKPCPCLATIFLFLVLLALTSIVEADDAKTQSDNKRLRVIVTSDFPPIGVVKGGKNSRSEAELNKFISKLRIFLIAYQDATHGWLMEEFPDLFIIDSRKTYQGMFGGRDPISNLAWVNQNVRTGHGALCDIYPHEGMGCTGVCEGDSPTFLYLISANRGINDPEDPTQPSWGGQYKRKESTNHYVDGPGGSSISRWRNDLQREFQDRADWCVSTQVSKAK